MRPRVALFCLVLLTLACASGPRSPRGASITPEELLIGAPLGAEREPLGLVPEGEVLALSPQMESFLDRHVDREADTRFRLRQLARAIIDAGDFGLQYDDTTHTAAETFRLRRGNCLSFSNMFLAMARRLGLHVYFQEVDVPPDWTVEQDAFVLSRHVNVVVDLGSGEDQVVDFSSEDFRAAYDQRTISDARALAHFDNNLGVQHMQAGDTASAVAYFRRALARDRSFAPAWTNLGALYLRNGHADYAEAAYLQALRVERGNQVAMSNLAGLYERQGDTALAEAYHSRVIAHRNGNPYYRYLLARDAYQAGDLDAAVGHLRYAVHKQPKEDRFCHLLGLVYLQQGEERAARRWLDRAVQLAPDEATKKKYADEISSLLRRSS